MVLKRPSSVGAAPPSSDKDVELMEHLVQKSLAINPSLRGAKSTGEVLEDLRKQAVTRSKSAPPTPEPPTPKVDLAERRRSTITFFFEQKAQEFKEAARELVAREQQLQKEKQGLKAKVVEELADFLVLVSGGGETPEARQVMRDFRVFLQDLGVTEADVLRVASRRR